MRRQIRLKPTIEIFLAELAFLSLNRLKFYLDQETTVYTEILLIPEFSFASNG
jgi:hypothetical protein